MQGLHKGNLEGGFFSGDAKKHVREGFGRGASLSYGGSMTGTWRGVSFLGTLRNTSGKALEGEHLSLVEAP
jgi:hypothetical protein